MRQGNIFLIIILIPIFCLSQVLTDEGKKEDLLRLPYAQWFESEYDAYNVDFDVLQSCSDQLSDVEFIIFMGTWCSDSRVQVPRFFKIMETIDNSFNYRLIYLNEDKNGAGGVEDEYGIEFVPTFIVIDKEKELGRIVESPKTSLEKDLCRII